MSRYFVEQNCYVVERKNEEGKFEPECVFEDLMDAFIYIGLKEEQVSIDSQYIVENDQYRIAKTVFIDSTDDDE